ncbi:hypothetical protein KKC65_01580 [Patescibacteria group bacterium]|nr:hypothetical protein [Patescibacteria group bacterium]
MVNIIILFLIFIGLIIHRYLTTFWEQGLLPYRFGFLLFANLFAFIYLVNYTWVFGLLVGTILSILSYFQIIYGSYLWLFLLPWLINIHRKPVMPKVSPVIYSGWSFLIIGLGILTVLNFFISDYMSLLKNILKSLDNNYTLFGLLLIGSMVMGNIIRIYLLKKYIIKKA